MMTKYKGILKNGKASYAIKMVLYVSKNQIGRTILRVTNFMPINVQSTCS